MVAKGTAFEKDDELFDIDQNKRSVRRFGFYV